jgi:hypothetical protein
MAFAGGNEDKRQSGYQGADYDREYKECVRCAEGCGRAPLVAGLGGDGLATVVLGANCWGRGMNEQNVSASSDIATRLFRALPRQSHPPHRNRREASRRVNVDQKSMELAEGHAKKSLSRLNA